MNEEYYIGIFGRRNQGKSSLMNLLSGQNISIVSALPGTTTDPVKKSIEIMGIGKCVFIDTAGFDDEGVLGKERVEKSKQTIHKLDAALLLFSGSEFSRIDQILAEELEKYKLPFVLIHNKSDETPLSKNLSLELLKKYPSSPLVDFSVSDSLTDTEKPNAQGLIPVKRSTTEHETFCRYTKISEALKKILPFHSKKNANVLRGIVKEGETVLLVTPIDGQAPEGRLILPQVQLARQCLDLHASCLMCQVEEISSCLANMTTPPCLIITDSQAFAEVYPLLPAHQLLSSFSICLARQKGNFEIYLQGTPFIEKLKDGDKILMLESCTHQVNCEDIGRVKLPRLLQKYTQKDLSFDFISGLDSLPKEVGQYALVIQCGGCMVTAKQLENRLVPFTQVGIPVSNYGMALAYVNGIFEKATAVFRQ
ncbi:MAG: [FeFe] hydrogenase H-cluster maturation GTPase HydF [Bacteroidales bacterium]